MTQHENTSTSAATAGDLASTDLAATDLTSTDLASTEPASTAGAPVSGAEVSSAVVSSAVVSSAVESGDVVPGEDGLRRPSWAARDPLLREYYDTEWGMPVHDEAGLFERLVLEGFQSGLSWLTILRKRPAFREAFAGFSPDVVAAFDEADIARLMDDTRIVRNRRKIDSAIANARAVIALRSEGGLDQLIWSFRPERTPEPRTFADVPSRSPESVALAKELKARGFSFVGPVTVFALMEAIGVVDTHLVDSHRRGSSGVWTGEVAAPAN